MAADSFTLDDRGSAGGFALGRWKILQSDTSDTSE